MNVELTKQEKIEAYEYALQIIDNDNEVSLPFICIHLIDWLEQNVQPGIDPEEFFPEFFLFKPKQYFDDSDCWWQDNNKGNFQRSLALLFAIEMVKHP